MFVLCELQVVVGLGELGLQQRLPGYPLANRRRAGSHVVLDVFLRYVLL